MTRVCVAFAGKNPIHNLRFRSTANDCAKDYELGPTVSASPLPKPCYIVARYIGSNVF